MTTIIMASSKKEAKEIAFNQYRYRAEYVKPYRYASKGNNFYEFKVESISKHYTPEYAQELATNKPTL